MNRAISNFVLIIILLFHISCSKYSREQKNIEKTVTHYYEVYKARKNFELFLSFYDDNILFIDIISGEKIVGKKKLKRFFNWDSENFELNSRNSLMIKDQVIKNNKVVTIGYFTPFRWNNMSYESMHFTSILYFNESGKITKQIDWINYPNNLLDYKSRANSNSWLLNN